APAEDFPRELVPQRFEREIPVARLRRKRARAEVDSGARKRERASGGNADRICSCAARPHVGWPRYPAGEHGRTASRGCRRLAEGSGRNWHLLQEIRRSPPGRTT